VNDSMLVEALHCILQDEDMEVINAVHDADVHVGAAKRD